MASNTKSYSSINLSIDNSDLIKQKFQEEIEIILDNQNEKNIVIPIPFSLPQSIGFNSKSDFEEKILEPIIQKEATKRNIDFNEAIELIAYRLKWEYCY